MMNLNTLREIRHQVYTCNKRSADALFELSDALRSEVAARSLPELSLSPFFRRRWASTYEALEDGEIDEACWTSVWTKALLEEHTGEVWVSIDSSSIARPQAETSPDREMIYVPNLPHAAKPVSVGWQFSTLMLLPSTASSWGGILSQRRIASNQSAISVAIEQLEQVWKLLPASSRLLADRWYATGPFLQACQRLQIAALIRLKRNRRLSRPAPPALMVSGELRAKMEPSFRGTSPTPGVNPMRPGVGGTGKVFLFRFKRGDGCMFAKHANAR